MTLENKTVLLTAGSRNFGRSLAERLLEEGAFVAITSRDEPATFHDWLGDRGMAFKVVCSDTAQKKR